MFSPGHTWQVGHQWHLGPNLGFFNQVTIMVGWAEAVWKAKFTRYFCTWPMLRVKHEPYRPESLPPYPLSHVCLLVESDENCPPPETNSNNCETMTEIFDIILQTRCHILTRAAGKQFYQNNIVLNQFWFSLYFLAITSWVKPSLVDHFRLYDTKFAYIGTLVNHQSHDHRWNPM